MYNHLKMKNLFLLLLICIPFSSFSQSINTIEAPIGFLRDEPKVTATILFRIQENEWVKVIERIDASWSKVEYVQDRKRMVGYITNQTLGETKNISKGNRLTMGPHQ
jgi:hypothetical protein